MSVVWHGSLSRCVDKRYTAHYMRQVDNSQHTSWQVVAIPSLVISWFQVPACDRAETCKVGCLVNEHMENAPHLFSPGSRVPLQRKECANPFPRLCPITCTDVQVVMTLVPRLVLSLRSSGREGIFSSRGACVAWKEGLLGDRFTSVPLPKAWMAFPVGESRKSNQEL